MASADFKTNGERPMRILFYLPVITRWWFDHIMVPMLRALHGQAELHVMVAPLWQNTGIEADQLAPLDDLSEISWHVIDADDPALFRTDGAAVPGLLETVAEIAPDLTLARSADEAVLTHFPGIVRHVMEGAAAPIETSPTAVILEERLFAKGLLPEEAALLAEMPHDAFAALAPASSLSARAFRDRFGLPYDRPIIAVPLHYEHEENFFLSHAAYPDGVAMIDALLAQFSDEVMLAVSDHPLNRKHLDRSALAERIAEEPERLALIDDDGASALLARHAAGIVVDQSKVWSLAAWHGTPILHIGRKPAADWLNAETDPRRFEAAILAGAARRPDAAMAQRWFAWHLGARLIDPAAETVTPDRLIAAALDAADRDAVARRLPAYLAPVPEPLS